MQPAFAKHVVELSKRQAQELEFESCRDGARLAEPEGTLLEGDIVTGVGYQSTAGLPVPALLRILETQLLTHEVVRITVLRPARVEREATKISLAGGGARLQRAPRIPVVSRAPQLNRVEGSDSETDSVAEELVHMGLPRDAAAKAGARHRGSITAIESYLASPAAEIPPAPPPTPQRIKVAAAAAAAPRRSSIVHESTEAISSFTRRLSRRISQRGSGGAGAGAESSAKHFYCELCFSNRQSDSFTLSACGHTFHRQCLVYFLGANINAGLLHLRCPHIGKEKAAAIEDCGLAITSDDLDTLLDATAKIKYGRMRLRKEGAEVQRACPQCQHSQSQAAMVSKVEWTCANCGHVYCQRHGDAHPGQTCERWEAALQASARERALLKRDSTSNAAVHQFRSCPGCAMPAQKGDDCNHMVA